MVLASEYTGDQQLCVSATLTFQQCLLSERDLVNTAIFEGQWWHNEEHDELDEDIDVRLLYLIVFPLGEQTDNLEHDVLRCRQVDNIFFR